MSGTFLYQWVLVSENPAESIRVLNDKAVCRLTGWLAQDYDANGKSGEVLGLCLGESTRRFMERVESQRRAAKTAATSGEGIL